MDPLARIEPVARPLLRDVDSALGTLGAPAEHPIWPMLRRLGVTPGDAVSFVAGIEPAPVRAASGAVRELASAYPLAVIPTDPAWQGAAAQLYTARAAALNGHLGASSHAGASGSVADSMVERLLSTASYLEDVAAWLEHSRDALAGALATVLTSAQVVTLAGGVPEPGHATGRVPAAVITAAADIGAFVLHTVGEAVEQGHQLRHRYAGLAEEVSQPPVADHGPISFDTMVRLRR